MLDLQKSFLKYNKRIEFKWFIKFPQDHTYIKVLIFWNISYLLIINKIYAKLLVNKWKCYIRLGVGSNNFSRIWAVPSRNHYHWRRLIRKCPFTYCASSQHPYFCIFRNWSAFSSISIRDNAWIVKTFINHQISFACWLFVTQKP